MDATKPSVMRHTQNGVWLDPDASMWLEFAAMVGIRKGTCTRRNVGAVLVANGRLREVAWNGMERTGLETCRGGACPRGQLSVEEQPHGVGYSNCVYLHAEFNAAENFRHSQRARTIQNWGRALGVTIYSSSVPCEDCTEYARWAGIDLVWEDSEQ